ncbi:MAG: hypothetical protein FWD52_09085 [Candidatus Bathyarchaeota archaeon]|nr:hypothetical protein [Candidatus Termiticorpusculum sp.]
MKSMAQKIVLTILVFALVAGCFAAMPLSANVASQPVLGGSAWKAGYSKSACKGVPSPMLYDCGDVSGDKISSNAHSADYTGLYFYWDDKQKDDGVLLVAERVFDLFQDNYSCKLPGANIKKNPADFTIVEFGKVILGLCLIS